MAVEQPIPIKKMLRQIQPEPKIELNSFINLLCLLAGMLTKGIHSNLESKSVHKKTTHKKFRTTSGREAKTHAKEQHSFALAVNN